MQSINYLLSLAFDLYLMIVLLRVWLQLARADFYNPMSQFVVRATNPLVKPLRRVIPGIGGVDWASVLLAVFVAGLKWALLMQINSGGIGWTSLAFIAPLAVVKEAGTMLFWILLVRAILSWVSQGRSPIEFVLLQLTEPLLTPIRRVLPAMGGLDLSILVMFVALNFMNLALTDLLPYWRIL
jgi:YggT family protein